MLQGGTRFLSLCFAVFAAVLLPFAASAQEPDLKAKLRDVALLSTLDQSGLKPWHLKLEVQLYDQFGKFSERGTVEEWWTAPDSYRVEYNLTSHKGAYVRTPSQFFNSPGSPRTPYLVGIALISVVDPIPSVSMIDRSTPVMRNETLLGSTFDCIVVGGGPAAPDGQIPMSPAAYCLDHDSGLLHLQYDHQKQVTVREKLGTFQKISIPLAVTVSANKRNEVGAQVTTLETQETPYPEATKLDGLTPGAMAPATASQITPPRLIKHVPLQPKLTGGEKRESGTVVVHVIVGKNGHVVEATPISSSSATLSDEVIDAVRAWVYEPARQNGQPVESETMVTMNYNLGH